MFRSVDFSSEEGVKKMPSGLLRLPYEATFPAVSSCFGLLL